MRDAFVAELLDLAVADPRVTVLSGDLGYGLWTDFVKDCPAQFINTGICEQAMVSIATGMALSGLRPITYTIAAFNLRALEQIRMAAYHKAPVVIVGIGAGYGYHNLGPSHHSCEDVAIMRSLPGMAVVCPGDPMEVRASLREAVKQNHPVYLRLGKRGEPNIHSSIPTAFKIGEALPVKQGTEVCLISTGTMLPEAAAAGHILDGLGLSAAVISMHTVKPLDDVFLETAAASYRVLVTIEEHSLIGGVGSAIAEWLSDREIRTTALLRLGTQDAFLRESGERHYALTQNGLTAEAIAARVKEKAGGSPAGLSIPYKTVPDRPGQY